MISALNNHSRCNKEHFKAWYASERCFQMVFGVEARYFLVGKIAFSIPKRKNDIDVIWPLFVKTCSVLERENDVLIKVL